MGRLSLYICLFLASAVSCDYGWKPKQEYTYNIEGRTLNGLASLDSQYAGIHYRGVFKVQAQSSTLLLMKLQNMTYTKIHEKVPEGWWNTIPLAADQFQDFPLSKNAFSVKMDRGVVESLSVSKDLDDWEVNFLQGLVGQIQMDVTGTNGIHASNTNIQHGKERDETVFRVMEDSVVGRCEVMYEVIQINAAVLNSWGANDVDWLPKADICGSKSYLEVIKTWNYDNCESRAEYHFGLPSRSCQPGSNQCGDYWRRSSTTRAHGCGDRKDFTLLHTITSSRILANLHLHNASMSSINSYTTMSLQTTKTAANSFSGPSQPLVIKDLFYRFSPSQESKSALKSGNNDNKSDSSSSESNQKHKSHSRVKRDKPKKSSKKSKKTPIRVIQSPAGNGYKSTSSHLNEEDSYWQLPKLDSDHAPFLPFSPSVANDNVKMVDQFKEMIQDIAHAFETSKEIPEEMTLEKVNMAIDICRRLSLQELKKVVDGVMDSSSGSNGQLTERKVYRDVLVMCGSAPSFQIIKSWIESKKVTGEAAAEILASLSEHLLTPTQDVVRRFYELTRSQAVRDDQQMKISAILSFTNLLRSACISNETRHSQYTVSLLGYAACTPADAEKYIPWIIEQMKSDKPLRKVYITALGNTGSISALQSLKTIIEDSSASSIERAMAVYAVKYQVFKNPNSMIPYLLSIFDNTGNPTAVRIAAVSIMFYAKPPMEVWQRIAVSTWYDPSLAVATFVRSSLKSFATIQDPFYAQISQLAASALPLSRPMSQSVHKPLNLVQTSVSDQLQEIILQQFSWLPGPIASNLYYRKRQRLSQFSWLDFEGSIWLTNPDSFLTVLQELVFQKNDFTAARPMIKSLPRSTKWLRENLKISERSLPKLEGLLRFNLNRMTERVVSFDSKIAEELNKAWRKLVDQMKTGQQYHYMKMDRSSMVIATTTEMGLPVHLQISAPWAVRANGDTKLSKDNTEFRLDASLMYTSELIACLKFHTGWDNMVHVSAWHANTHVQLPPLRLQAQWDTSNSEFEVAMSIIDKSVSSRVAHHSSRTFTSQTGAHMITPLSLIRSTQILRDDNPQQRTLSLSNVQLLINGSMSPSANRSKLWEPVSVLGFQMLSTRLEEFSADLILTKLAPITITFNLGRAIVENGNINMTLLPGANRRDPQNDTESSTDTSKTATTTSTTTEQETNTTEQSATGTDSSVELSTPTDKQEKKSEKRNQDIVEVYSAAIDQNAGDFTAGNVNPFANDDKDETHKYLLARVLRGINNGHAYVVGMHLTVHAEEPRTYKAYSTYARGVMMKHHRYGLFFRNEEANSQMAFTSIADLPSTPLLDLEQIMNNPVLARFVADYDHKFSDERWQTSFETTITRSEGKREAVRQSSQYKKCLQPKNNIQPVCRQMADKVGYLDLYNITLHFNDAIKSGSNASITRAMAMVRSFLLPYRQDFINTGEDLKNSAWWTIEMSEDMQTADVQLRSGCNHVKYGDIPITPLAANILKYSPDNTMQRGVVSPGYCGLSKTNVITYDEVAFKYNISNCWHVITKDASGKSRFVVLAKANDHEQLEVEINLDNYKVINLKSTSEFSVNQDQIALSKKQVLIVKDQAGVLLVRMYQGLDDSIKILLPAHGLEMAYNSDSLFIQGGEGTRGRLVGVCGDNNHQRIGEFRNPSDRLEKTPYAFAASYAVKDSDCKEFPAPSKN